jgi:transcriptional regulator with XRE-family HTH domain
MQNLLDMHMHQMQSEGMTLDDYLSKNGISTNKAAIALGKDASLLSRYRNRKVTPSPPMIAKIVEWSGGNITPRDLLAETEAVAV